MATTRQFDLVNLASNEGVAHALGDAFHHVAQGLARVQEALRMQEASTAQRIQEALLRHEESAATAMRDALRRVEQKLQDRDEAVGAMERRLAAQIESVEERLSVLEERRIPFRDRAEIAKAGGRGSFETRLKTLEASVQRALDCVFPRVDALLAHLERPSPAPMWRCAAPVSASLSRSAPSLSAPTSACAPPSASHSTASAASNPRRPASDILEAAEDGAGGQPSTDHQGAVGEEQREKQLVETQVQEILTMRHNASAPSTSLGERLCRAVCEDELQYVRCLLDSGADVNYVAMHGDSPLISALSCRAPNPNVVSLLLERGADVNSVDEYGMTPLHHAAANDHKCRCVPLLIRSGANLNARDKDGETPLHWAAAKNNEAAVRALLAAGARKDLKGWGGRWKDITPFDIAVLDVLQNLLRP